MKRNEPIEMSSIRIIVYYLAYTACSNIVDIFGEPIFIVSLFFHFSPVVSRT